MPLDMELEAYLRPPDAKMSPYPAKVITLATGVAQAVELVWQLRDEAGEQQGEGAEAGFSLNFGEGVVALVLRRDHEPYYGLQMHPV